MSYRKLCSYSHRIITYSECWVWTLILHLSLPATHFKNEVQQMLFKLLNLYYVKDEAFSTPT